jgi:hypothetical protein
MPASDKFPRRPSVFVCPRSLARCSLPPISTPALAHKAELLDGIRGELRALCERKTIWHTPLVGMDKWAACLRVVSHFVSFATKWQGEFAQKGWGGMHALSFPSAYAQFGFAFQRVVSCCSELCHALFTVRNMHPASETSSRNCYYTFGNSRGRLVLLICILQDNVINILCTRRSPFSRFTY